MSWIAAIQEDRLFGSQTQPADLTPFKKQVVVRIRHQMSVILGNIGEIVALDYLESKGYKVCKIDDHAMTISLYDLKAENRLEMQQPSLGRVSSREYRIPILDLHAHWKSMDGEVARFCKHMQPFLAKKLWECYCSYRFQHHLQFPDLLAHKDGKHYVVEVKTNRGRVTKEQEEFMHSLQKQGLETMVIRVIIDPELLMRDVL